jgi:hypothetical protein
MLIESEHNIAREDREGSATEMEFMVVVSFVGEVFWRFKNPKTDSLDSR